jgi:hypothetical protein
VFSPILPTRSYSKGRIAMMMTCTITAKQNLKGSSSTRKTSLALRGWIIRIPIPQAMLDLGASSCPQPLFIKADEKDS